MFEKLKDFLLNQLTGRLLVRASASLVAYLASGSIGLHISVDPSEVNLLLNTLLHGLISKLKPRTKEAALEAPVAEIAK